MVGQSSSEMRGKLFSNANVAQQDISLHARDVVGFVVNAGHAEGPDWTIRHRQDTVGQSSSS